jgi:hypothetical protein
MFSAFKRPREEDEIGFGEHETKVFLAFTSCWNNTNLISVE